MVKLVTIDKNSKLYNVINRYYLHDIMPICINKTEVEGLYYVELLCDTITDVGVEHICVILAFTVDSEKDKKRIEKDSNYVDNILKNKRRKAVYDKLEKFKNQNKVYMTSFNMTAVKSFIKDSNNNFHISKLYDVDDRSKESLMYISEIMLIRISTFLKFLLKYDSIPFELFTETKYQYMTKVDKEYVDSDNVLAKISDIIVGDSVFEVIQDRKGFKYTVFTLKEYLDRRRQ